MTPQVREVGGPWGGCRGALDRLGGVPPALTAGTKWFSDSMTPPRRTASCKTLGGDKSQWDPKVVALDLHSVSTGTHHAEGGMGGVSGLGMILGLGEASGQGRESWGWGGTLGVGSRNIWGQRCLSGGWGHHVGVETGGGMT